MMFCHTIPQLSETPPLKYFEQASDLIMIYWFFSAQEITLWVIKTDSICDDDPFFLVEGILYMAYQLVLACEKSKFTTFATSSSAFKFPSLLQLSLR